MFIIYIIHVCICVCIYIYYIYIYIFMYEIYVYISLNPESKSVYVQFCRLVQMLVPSLLAIELNNCCCP